MSVKTPTNELFPKQRSENDDDRDRSFMVSDLLKLWRLGRDQGDLCGAGAERPLAGGLQAAEANSPLKSCMLSGGIEQLAPDRTAVDSSMPKYFMTKFRKVAYTSLISSVGNYNPINANEI